MHGRECQILAWKSTLNFSLNFPWLVLCGHTVGRDVALPHRREAPRQPPVYVLVVDNLQALSLPEAHVLAGLLGVVEYRDEDGGPWHVSVGRRPEGRYLRRDFGAQFLLLEGGGVVRTAGGAVGLLSTLFVLWRGALRTVHGV